jgi:hypothetical protein
LILESSINGLGGLSGGLGDGSEVGGEDGLEEAELLEGKGGR